MFPQLDDRLPSEWAPLHPYTPSDSTDPAAFPSPLGAASWGHDGFSHDPGFLASQEELRCMLFNIAQSAAPTRAPSPESHILREFEIPARPVLSNPRRVEYLKNYVGQVAPWVCHYAAIPLPAPSPCVNPRAKRLLSDPNNKSVANHALARYVRFAVHVPRPNSRARSIVSRAVERDSCHIRPTNGKEGGYPRLIR